MLIRNIDRTLLPRTIADAKGKDANPMRKTAEGLGTFLSRLSESVRESRAAQLAALRGEDSVDSNIKAQHRTPMRTFKWPAPYEEGKAAAPAVDINLSEEQAEALDKLREARGIASDASSPAVSNDERTVAQERIQTLFNELSVSRAYTLSSMLDGTNGSDSSPFSIINPESARGAYNVIDQMIMRYLEVEAGSGANNAEVANSEHEAALNASDQLKEFLLNEGPARAFSRFREIDRNNVLGLVHQ
ncbi:MAG: hypothetical protein FWC23_04655 [Chitinispirillia bacterium]|nr:hypothetical protein [Chitinispirillia bacterium]MCL2268458.1 hypothetical protein [Chitinispirillia bacterium]